MAKPTREYLKGRQAIGGRKLRYSACNDILMVVHQILTEYVADCKSPYFHTEHPELPQVEALVEEDVNEMEAPAMREWLTEVAELLPQLWD
jgi:hypothetical protein